MTPRRKVRTVFRWGWLFRLDRVEVEALTEARTWFTGWELVEMQGRELGQSPGDEDDLKRLRLWYACGIIATWDEPAPRRRKGARP